MLFVSESGAAVKRCVFSSMTCEKQTDYRLLQQLVPPPPSLLVI